MNSVPWSHTSLVGHGYLVNHAISTRLAILIAVLSFSMDAISNHPVAGSIIVTAYSFNGFSLPRVGIVYGPTRSTHSISHGSLFASLGVTLPCFLV